MSKSKAALAEAAKVSADAVAELHEILKPRDRVTVVCVKPASGGNGVAHYVVLVADTEGCYDRKRDQGRHFARDVTHLVAKAVGHKISQQTGGIVMGGWGYSKAFQIVYGLGRVMWPNGTPEPHGTRNGEPDSDGGYALRQN